MEKGDTNSALSVSVIVYPKRKGKRDKTQKGATRGAVLRYQSKDRAGLCVLVAGPIHYLPSSIVSTG
jgi:hypothetical protein